MKQNDTMCNAANKPDVSSIEPKTCNVEACDSYEWKTKDGTCSVSCGDGRQNCYLIRIIISVCRMKCSISISAVLYIP